MRIVQLVENLELGGLERLAADLAIAHKRSGHHVLVYCLQDSGPLSGCLEAAGIEVVPFHKPAGFSLATVRSIASRLRADRIDVVHGHNPGVHHYGALAAKIAGVPVCLNTRHSVTSSKGIPYQERYFRWVKPFTRHVVFVCDYVQQGLKPKIGYPASKCSVILNGIPLEQFLAKPAAPGTHPPRLRFGTIGRLVPAKGHAVLIDAFARVANEAPAAELSIFGYGGLESELQAQIARLGLQGKVRLEGRTEDSPAALQSLDVFVFSSVNEGLPLVIMEAMAAGLPVISTDVGGIPEVLPKGSAWMCPPGNPEALAAAMIEAAHCNDLPQRGISSRALAVANYGLDHMARRYEELYQRLAS